MDMIHMPLLMQTLFRRLSSVIPHMDSSVPSSECSMEDASAAPSASRSTDSCTNTLLQATSVTSTSDRGGPGARPGPHRITSASELLHHMSIRQSIRSGMALAGGFHAAAGGCHAPAAGGFHASASAGGLPSPACRLPSSPPSRPFPASAISFPSLSPVAEADDGAGGGNTATTTAPSPARSMLFIIPKLTAGHLVLSCNVRLPAEPYGCDSLRVVHGRFASELHGRSRGSGLRVERLHRPLHEKLFRSVRYNDLERVNRLVARNVDVNYADHSGRTALHLAAAQGYAEITTVLLGVGAKPEVSDRRGNTPLHLAITTSRWKVVKLLLAAGANVWTKNGANTSAIEMARRKLETFSHLKIASPAYMEEIRAVYDLLLAARSTCPSSDNTARDAAGLTVSDIDSILGKIEHLSIEGASSGQTDSSAPISLRDVSAELNKMSLSANANKSR